jgi:hypothetical protein
MMRQTGRFRIIMATISLNVVITQLGAADLPALNDGAQYRSRMNEKLAARITEMRQRDAVWRSLPAAEREAILKPIRERADRESNELTKSTDKAPDDPLEECPFRGLLNSDEVTVLFHRWEFKVNNYWGGILNGCQRVYAGYEPRNPLQGHLAIYDHPGQWAAYDLFPTPTATGPVRIIGERDGVLTLESLSGIFDRDTSSDPAGGPDGSTVAHVTTPGGARYVFDLRTLRYLP